MRQGHPTDPHTISRGSCSTSCPYCSFWLLCGGSEGENAKVSPCERNEASKTEVPPIHSGQPLCLSASQFSLPTTDIPGLFLDTRMPHLPFFSVSSPNFFMLCASGAFSLYIPRTFTSHMWSPTTCLPT